MITNVVYYVLINEGNTNQPTHSNTPNYACITSNWEEFKTWYIKMLNDTIDQQKKITYLG